MSSSRSGGNVEARNDHAASWRPSKKPKDHRSVSLPANSDTRTLRLIDRFAADTMPRIMKACPWSINGLAVSAISQEIAVASFGGYVRQLAAVFFTDATCARGANSEVGVTSCNSLSVELQVVKTTSELSPKPQRSESDATCPAQMAHLIDLAVREDRSGQADARR